MKLTLLPRAALYLSSVVLLLAASPAHATSATWLADPVSGDWNAAANWGVVFPPQNGTQTATFGTSNITDMYFSATSAQIGGVVFEAGASAYNFNVGTSLFGVYIGVANNSGVTQNFVISGSSDTSVFSGVMEFGGPASSGTQTTYTANGASVNNKSGAQVRFIDTATAGSAIITANGNTVAGAPGATIHFDDDTSAGDAVLTANGGTNGGGGSRITFAMRSTGGTSTVSIFDDSILDLTSLNYTESVTIGSLAGDGTVQLHNRTLIVGSNNTDTTFSGSINGSDLGAFAKIGTGTFQLSGASSYVGGTSVNAGTLVVANSQALGTGAVTVRSGATLRIESGTTMANALTLAGGSYQRALANGADLANAVNVTSSVGGGRPATTATILQGTLSSSTILETSFQSASLANNDSVRTSAVYSFHGTGSDIFVLQLSMTSVTADSYLMWLNTNAESATFNQWVNAVDGNTGASTPTLVLGAYNSATDFHLGYYGVDLATGTVWAVVNHNSDFAIGTVPEPATWALFVIGAAGLLLLRRRALSGVRSV